MEDLPQTQTSLPIEQGLVQVDMDHDELLSEKLLFATDEQLAAMLRAAESRAEGVDRRLRQVEAYCQDQAARAPGMVRECEQLRLEQAAIAQAVEKVREQLEPRSQSTDGLKPAA